MDARRLFEFDASQRIQATHDGCDKPCDPLIDGKLAEPVGSSDSFNVGAGLITEIGSRALVSFLLQVRLRHQTSTSECTENGSKHRPKSGEDMMDWARIFVVIVVGLLAFQATQAKASEPKAIIVLDGSGSMWGQVNQTPKIQIAKDVIGSLLSNWDQKTELGVIAYGHRTKGDCDDIETLVPVGRVDKRSIMNTIRTVNPKGKTPITSAIRKAAEQLKYTENSARIVLVSDGLETCNLDPCELATTLETYGVDLDVHVVGFDLRPEETAQLKCIADNTGGRFVNASSANELSDALKQTVEKFGETEKEILFAETFDDDAERGTALNFATFDQFTLASGSVDIISNGGYGIYCVGNSGGCVDLDGTRRGDKPASRFVSRKIAFRGGKSYQLSFALSGNQRGYPDDVVQVYLGQENVGNVGPVPSNEPFTTYKVNFSTQKDVKLSISFIIPDEADLVGPILDDVYVKPVAIETDN